MDKSPQEFGVGDANANCPPDFVRYKKGRSVAFKIRQNPFSAGAVSTPLPIPLAPRTDPPSALTMRPQNFSQIYAYMKLSQAAQQRRTVVVGLILVRKLIANEKFDPL